MQTPDYITITKWQADRGNFISYHPELPTVISQGETPAEAEANLVEVTELAIQHLEAHGLPVPMPHNFQSALVDLSYP
jgi:predicted RNase H-like HicB family nuclease